MTNTREQQKFLEDYAKAAISKKNLSALSTWLGLLIGIANILHTFEQVITFKTGVPVLDIFLNTIACIVAFYLVFLGVNEIREEFNDKEKENY